MRLIVAGSRKWQNVKVIYDSLDVLLSNIDMATVTILSGHCDNSDEAKKLGIIDSPDMAGEEYARMRGLDLETYPATWKKYNPKNPKAPLYDKSAGYKRNAKMANLATHLAAFWDHKSRGTKHMIDLAQKKGLIVAIIDEKGNISRC